VEEKRKNRGEGLGEKPWSDTFPVKTRVLNGKKGFATLFGYVRCTCQPFGSPA
jgi:hypothetical protein